MSFYPLNFKAAILEQSNEPLTIDEVTFSGPLEVGQVLVRFQYSGICGKQIEEIKASAGPDPYLPHMLGHEGSGVVVDVGPGVKKVKLDDFVVVHWLKGSGIDAGTPYYTRRGERVNAGWLTTFNEYGVVPENRVTPIPHDSDMAVAALLGCAVTTGLGVIFNEANVRPGESVAVFGCGGVGLNVVQGATLIQARPIIAVDINPQSLALAAELGATHTINASTADVPAEIAEYTDGQGAQFVVVATASPEGIRTAVEVSAIPGSVYMVSVPPAGATVTLSSLDIHRRRMLTGSYGGGSIPDRHIPGYLALHSRGALDLSRVITKVVSLERINEAINLMMSERHVGRCIVRMVN